MIEPCNPLEMMTFTYDKCFLCGEILTEENSSEEHVFPRWLQNKFNLWNQEITLLNGTSIRYKNLKIPCCKECNNEHLSSKLERKVQQAVDGGYEEFIKLDHSIISRWLAKLSYGMLFKELSLKSDMKNNSSESIVTPDVLDKFSTMYSFLKTIRYNTEFEGTPWSILIFNIASEDVFVYAAQDQIMCNCFFMRINDIGIVANLQDGGCLREFFIENNGRLLDGKLTHIQFREICAQFLYKSSLYNKTPFFIYSIPNNTSQKCTILSQQMGGYVFNDWNQKEYARILEFYLKPWDIKFDELYTDDDRILTFLFNEDGSIKNLINLSEKSL